jgi:hypothetical protein
MKTAALLSASVGLMTLMCMPVTAAEPQTLVQNGFANVKAVILLPGDANRDLAIKQTGYFNSSAVLAIGGNGKYTITQTGQQNNTVSALLGSKQTLNINQSFSPGGWASFAGMGRR